MSASNTCDGCSLVVEPENPLLETWLILYVPKEPEPTPEPSFVELSQLMAMMQGGGKPKEKYHRLEFCSVTCLATKALTMSLAQETFESR